MRSRAGKDQQSGRSPARPALQVVASCAVLLMGVGAGTPAWAVTAHPAGPGQAVAAPAVAAPAVAVPAPVVAPSAAQVAITSQLTALEQRYQEASVGELNLLGQMNATRTTLTTLTTTEAALDAWVAAGQVKLQAVQSRYDVQTQQLVAAENDLAGVESQLGQTRAQLKQRAVQAYMGQPASGIEQDLLSSSQGQNALTRLSYLSSIVAEQQKAEQRFQDLQHQAGQLERDVRRARDASLSDRTTLQTQLAALATARGQQEALRQSAQATSVHQAVLLSKLQAEKGDFEAQMMALANQSAAITVRLQQLQAGRPAPAAGSAGLLAFPIPGAPITSPFGPRTDPVYGVLGFHPGVDFGAAMGTPIQAAADGDVVSAGVLGGYGNCTLIDNGSSMATLYAHQSVLLVVAGQHVLRGQIIGLVGSTGFSTGPHLHFEVRLKGTPVDPVPFL